MRIVGYITLLTLCQVSFSQVYLEGGKTRHRFAQLNLGLETKVFLPFGTEEFTKNQGDEWIKNKMKYQLQENFVIGGTHFWGHADFYISIPLFNIYQPNYRRSVETGMKVYPWQLQSHKLKPFLGVAWAPSSYSLSEGSKKYIHELPLAIGVSFLQKSWLFEITGQYVFNNQFSYATSVNNFHNVVTPSININVGFKWMFDTTLGAEKGWKNGKTKLLTDTLSVLKELSGLTVSVGPSSAVYLRESNHNIVHNPFIHEHSFSNLFLEFGLGYYWFKSDMHFNFTYRGIKSKQSGFGLHQLSRRRSLALELTKFLVDFHGFVPFVGFCGSYEWLTLQENQDKKEINYTDQQFAAGIVFGWDIRPDQLQLIYLRTSLRWYPNLKIITTDQASFSFSQLEFNFITAVIMVERLF